MWRGQTRLQRWALASAGHFFRSSSPHRRWRGRRLQYLDRSTCTPLALGFDSWVTAMGERGVGSWEAVIGYDWVLYGMSMEDS